MSNALSEIRRRLRFVLAFSTVLLCVVARGQMPAHATSGVADRVAATAHEADINVILKRPLFAPTRRMQQQDKDPAAPVSNMPRLSGILVIGGARRAIFEDGGSVRVVSVGDKLGIDRVIAIAPVEVTILGRGGVYTLHPGFSGSAAAARRARTLNQPNLIDQLNTSVPPHIAVPPHPSIIQMLSHLPKSH